MKTSVVYKDYPVQPYISDHRDVIHWEKFPEEYPYQKVERKQMEYLEDDLLPGDIILLWRVSLGTFDSKSVYPNYFEYKYGIYGPDHLELLIEKGLVRKCTASESLNNLSAVVLKRILKQHNLDLKGKKQDLLDRAIAHIGDEELSSAFDVRRMMITPKGEEILAKYYDLVLKHGPKM